MDAVIFFPPLFALIAGLIILFVPRALSIVVAIYLILVGVIGLVPQILLFLG